MHKYDVASNALLMHLTKVEQLPILRMIMVWCMVEVAMAVIRIKIIEKS